MCLYYYVVKFVTFVLWKYKHFSLKWPYLELLEFKQPYLLNPVRYCTFGERGGSVVECRTPEREVGGSKPTAAMLCPWARYFTPLKNWLITQEAVAPSRHDWKIVDWNVKPQHKQTKDIVFKFSGFSRLINCCQVIEDWKPKSQRLQNFHFPQ